MPDSGSPRDKSVKRSLPSWMGSNENSSKSNKKKHIEATEQSTNKSSSRLSRSEEEESEEPKGQTNSNLNKKKDNGSREDPRKPIAESSSSSVENTQNSAGISKLMDGVVFALSGFVNPERGNLRSQALDMGAEYRADWTADCTLLVCAFPNTPKFRQVESQSGTIVSKDWIVECHKEKKLVAIEPYLMHAGKPWRKCQDQAESKKAGKGLAAQKNLSTKEHESIKDESHNKAQSLETLFPPSKVKLWAMNDLRETILWLEDQEEKPEATEIKAIAAEGIITCLQDVIGSLKQGKDVKSVTEQWKFAPRVARELARLDGSGGDSRQHSKDELCKQATRCMKIYESEFNRKDDLPGKGKDSMNVSKQSSGSSSNARRISDDAECDSDDTIEMTEEEIELACKEIPGLCS